MRESELYLEAWPGTNCQVRSDEELLPRAPEKEMKTISDSCWIWFQRTAVGAYSSLTFVFHNKLCCNAHNAFLFQH